MIKILTSHDNWQRAASCYIRLSVFVLERGITLQDEFDDADIDGTTYVVAYDDQLPVATGRYIQDSDSVARFTRIATLKSHRGQHLGRQIKTLAYQNHITKILIHAELTAKSFYEELGYTASSDIYDEDGVPCQTLSKQL